MTLTTERIGAADIRVWTAGTGSPLLYLHGLERHPGDAPFLQALAKTHRVIAPEHPGYGESTGFEGMRDVIDVALHYRRVVESLADGPVDVIGHCLGGMFAAEFAATSPHLVRKLVLVAPYGLWRDDVPIPDPFAIENANFARAKSTLSWAKTALANPALPRCSRAFIDPGSVTSFGMTNPSTWHLHETRSRRASRSSTKSR